MYFLFSKKFLKSIMAPMISGSKDIKIHNLKLLIKILKKKKQTIQTKKIY